MGFRLSSPDQLEQRRAVLLEFFCAYAADAAERIVFARAVARNLREGAVVEDHIGGNRLAARFRAPPCLQSPEESEFIAAKVSGCTCTHARDRLAARARAR